MLKLWILAISQTVVVALICAILTFSVLMVAYKGLSASFWSQFVPSLVSTFFGVLLGVPASLWLSRIGTREADAKARRERQQRLRDCLAALEVTFAHNERSLVDATKALTEGSAFFDLSVEASTWDALQPIVTADFPDTQLLRRIVFHFDRIRAIRRLAILQGELSYGVASAVRDIAATRTQLNAELYQQCVKLLVEARELKAALAQMVASAQPES